MRNLIYTIGLLVTFRNLTVMFFLSPIGYMTYTFTSAGIALFTAL